jgi:hypothetical protein
MRHRQGRLLLAALALWTIVLVLGSSAGRADDAQNKADPTPDDDLLEFLGSVDPSSDSAQQDDGAWIDYLSQTDIGKVAKPAGTQTGTDPKPTATATAAKPSASGVKNQ